MAKKDKASDLVEARILCEFWNGERSVKADEHVVQLSPDVLEQYKAAGWVDGHPDAVAYAKSLKG